MRKLAILILVFISNMSIGQKRIIKTTAKKNSLEIEQKTIKNVAIEKIELDTLLVINKITDEMDKSTMLSASRKMICFEDDKSIGFIISVIIRRDFSISYLMLNALNIGNCDEGGELLFLFEDNTNLRMNSFDEFNCEGRSAYEISEKNINIINSKKIQKIRYTNGRSGESYTNTVKLIDKDYFIRVFKLANNKLSIDK